MSKEKSNLDYSQLLIAERNAHFITTEAAMSIYHAIGSDIVKKYDREAYNIGREVEQTGVLKGTSLMWFSVHILTLFYRLKGNV